MRSRALFALFALAALTLAAPLVACGDDGPASPATDTLSAPDAPDAPDANTADTELNASDSALPDDTAPGEDAPPVDDTAVAEDTAEAADTVPAPDGATDDTTAPTDALEPDLDAVQHDAVQDSEEPAADTCCSATDTTPADPYAGLYDAALRAVLLSEATAGHHALGYTLARDKMYAVGGIDDVAGRIECIYTGRTVDATGSRTPNKNCRLVDGTPTSCGFNTEHTWARYYLDLALTEGSTAYNAAESDIHHIFPSEEGVNTARWHFDFGATTCLADGSCKINEQSQVGQRPGITGFANCPTGNLAQSHVCLMQVRPVRRGDIARGLFYMAVRYAMPMVDTMEVELRGWNLADPPDAREETRNDGIEAAQGNRNPFVDRPDLVDRISDF